MLSRHDRCGEYTQRFISIELQFACSLCLGIFLLFPFVSINPTLLSLPLVSQHVHVTGGINAACLSDTLAMQPMIVASKLIAPDSYYFHPTLAAPGWASRWPRKLMLDSSIHPSTSPNKARRQIEGPSCQGPQRINIKPFGPRRSASRWQLGPVGATDLRWFLVGSGGALGALEL